jgi:Flp pilus assembly protein TadD
LSQKRVPEAIKAYERALTNGADSTGLIKLHRALHLSGDTKSAEQRLQGWLKQRPEDVAVHAYAAEHYMATQRDREAIVQYEEVLRLAARNAVALNNLAILYQRAKDSRALGVAEQAHKLAPDHPGVKDTLGWILLQEGQLPRAVDVLGDAASKAPKAGAIRYHYGVALARSGRKAEAKKELQAAIASGQKFTGLEEAKSLLKRL